MDSATSSCNQDQGRSLTAMATVKQEDSGSLGKETGNGAGWIIWSLEKMASLNQCSFIGNLGSDMELRWTQGGVAVGNVSIAVNEKYKEKETTTWVKLVFFGKQAEIVDKYAGKGSSLFVSGRLQTSNYEKDGQTHYSTDIIVKEFQFLDSKKDGGGR